MYESHNCRLARATCITTDEPGLGKAHSTESLLPMDETEIDRPGQKRTTLTTTATTISLFHNGVAPKTDGPTTTTTGMVVLEEKSLIRTKKDTFSENRQNCPF